MTTSVRKTHDMQRATSFCHLQNRGGAYLEFSLCFDAVYGS